MMTGATSRPDLANVLQRQIREFQDTFAIFDRERKGHTTVEVFRDSLSFIGMMLSEDILETVKLVFKLLDPEMKGDELRFREFCIGVARIEKMGDSPHERLLKEMKARCMSFRNAFLTFDIDHSGQVDADEFMIGMGKLTEEPDRELIERLMREADDNDNGEVDFIEFIKMLCVYPIGHPLRLKEPDFLVVRMWDKIKILEQAFASLDVTKLGFLTEEDMKVTCALTGELNSLDPHEAKVLLKESIGNGDTTGNKASILTS